MQLALIALREKHGGAEKENRRESLHLVFGPCFGCAPTRSAGCGTLAPPGGPFVSVAAMLHLGYSLNLCFVQGFFSLVTHPSTNSKQVSQIWQKHHKIESPA